MTSLMTLPTKDSHDHRDMQRASHHRPGAVWRDLAGANRQPGRLHRRVAPVVAGVEAAARVLAYQPYTFTSGDEVKFQRGPDYFSVWVNGSVMMTVPVDWEADR